MQGKAPRNYWLLILILFSIEIHTLPAIAQISLSCENLYDKAPVITEIVVERQPVFSETDPLPRWLSAETVNRFHTLSQQHLITQELLFKRGESLDRYRIEETLRNLRELGILQHEEIRCEALPDNQVLVRVVTRDAWSFEPILDFAIFDSGTTWTAGFREFNLMGQGKQLRAFYSDHFGDAQVGASFFDPRIHGSRWRWSASGLDFDSGESASLAIAYPFYSLETKWGGGISLSHLSEEEFLVNDGIITNQFKARRQNLTVSAAYAVKASTSLAHRLGLFYRYAQRDFEPIATALTAPPADRGEAPVGINYSLIVARYITERRIFHFDRPEYFNLGNSLTAEIGYSSPAFGGDTDELIFGLSDTQGYALREGHFTRAFVSAAGRVHQGRVENFQGQIRLQWFLRNTTIDTDLLRHTFLVDTDFVYTKRLDADRFLSLGESNGLRGYPNYLFTGNRLLRLTFEDRIFADQKIAGLFVLGGVVFANSGYVWDEKESFDLGDLITGAGFGFRVALPASSTEQVIRIDVAWPLNEVAGDDGKPKFTIVTATEF